ncbi:MAG: hypothetical protein JO356_10380, partial [Acidobacteria bacterium]|nr:hypothetical protein [Acidobacteriota bacterium]
MCRQSSIRLFLAVVFACAIVPLHAQVAMNVSIQPSSGIAGVTNVNAIGSGFPVDHGAITPANVTLSLSSSCGGPSMATAPGLSVTAVTGTQRRVSFTIPQNLVAGNYFVTLQGTTSDGSSFSSNPNSCSELNVTHTDASTHGSCAAKGPLAVSAPPSGGPVNVFAPNGCWNCTKTGIEAVTIEGARFHTTIATPAAVNSCASNPTTGKTVCVANNNDIYVINGTSLSKTLQSASDGYPGECKNCGVAINPVNNQAVISIGLDFNKHFPARTGLQVLDLNTDTLSNFFPTRNAVAELSIDSLRGFVLSTGGDNNYSLLSLSADGSLKEFGNVIPPAQELGTATDDCSTGIALAANETNANLLLADLTQATFTPGTPGQWSAPQQSFTFQDGFAGTGVAVAQGNSHLAILIPEFVNGGQFTVIQLPEESGIGTPSLVDYVAANIPGFSGTADPHAISAYTSPNDGKAYGVMVSGAPATAVARVDLACVLALPRIAGHHAVAGSALSCIQIFDTGNGPSAPPTITFNPRTNATSGLLFQDRVTATDVNTFSLRFRLDAAPDGMEINSATGDLQWIPSRSQAGPQNV